MLGPPVSATTHHGGPDWLAQQANCLAWRSGPRWCWYLVAQGLVACRALNASVHSASEVVLVQLAGPRCNPGAPGSAERLEPFGVCAKQWEHLQLPSSSDFVGMRQVEAHAKVFFAFATDCLKQANALAPTRRVASGRALKARPRLLARGGGRGWLSCIGTCWAHWYAVELRRTHAEAREGLCGWRTRP
jgi:hypothetical protein